MVETGHELTYCDGVCCRYSWHPNWNWPEGRRKSLCLRGCFGLAGQEHEMCSVGELPLWVNAKWRSFLLDSLLSKTAEVQVPVQVQVLLKNIWLCMLHLRRAWDWTYHFHGRATMSLFFYILSVFPQFLKFTYPPGYQAWQGVISLVLNFLIIHSHLLSCI